MWHSQCLVDTNSAHHITGMPPEWLGAGRPRPHRRGRRLALPLAPGRRGGARGGMDGRTLARRLRPQAPRQETGERHRRWRRPVLAPALHRRRPDPPTAGRGPSGDRSLPRDVHEQGAARGDPALPRRPTGHRRHPHRGDQPRPSRACLRDVAPACARGRGDLRLSPHSIGQPSHGETRYGPWSRRETLSNPHSRATLTDGPQAMLGIMNLLICPACGHMWQTFATGTTSRCGECGHTTYVPVGLRRVPAPPYRVSCGDCGYTWWCTSASGRTECRGCGARIYVPVSDRGGMPGPARRHAPPAPRPVVSTPARVVATSPRAVPPDPLSTLVDALLAGATRQAPARSPSPVRRGAPMPARAVSPPAAGVVPAMRCPTCGTGVARCGLGGCPMPPAP
jgi:hypothetical protein